MFKYLFYVFLLCSLSLESQTCEQIRAMAQKLDTARNSDTTGEDHYAYGFFLAQQVVAQNECISNDVLYEFSNAYAHAADLGHAKAGARLALINLYGLLNRPMNYQRAYDVSKLMVRQAASNNFENDWDGYGWMNAAVMLDKAERLKVDLDANSYMAAVFKKMKGFTPPPLSPSAPNSEKRIRHDFKVAMYEAYRDGRYGSEVDANSALEVASQMEWDSFHDRFVELVKQNKLSQDLMPNTALQMIMCAHSVKSTVFMREVRDYCANFLNEHIDDFKNSDDFVAALNQNSQQWLKEWNGELFKEYGNASNMYQEIINSEYIESKTGKEGWKFLPKKEKTRLFNIAIDREDESMEDKERFDIFKAMVLNGESRGLYWLGEAYRFGRGVNTDNDKAITYLSQAIDAGVFKRKAQFSLALIYDFSDGYQNWNEAYRLYDQIVDTDEFPEAIREWASMTYMGLGGSVQNKNAAIDAMQRCADLGNHICKLKLPVLKALAGRPNSYESKIVSVQPVNATYPDVLNLTKSSMSFKYTIDVLPNNNDTEVQMFTQRNPDVYSMHHFRFAPSSGKITDHGTYTASISPYSKGYRDFGFMSVVLSVDGNSGFLDNIPLAVYSLPQEE